MDPEKRPELSFEDFEAIRVKSGNAFRDGLLRSGFNPDDVEPLAREFESEVIDSLREKFAITVPKSA